MMGKAPVPVPRKILGISNEKRCETPIDNLRSHPMNKTVRKPASHFKDAEDDHENQTENRETDPDLNLSTLICSVERDIELLEQLEMNSGEHRGALPLPVSSKLLGLPGYRPRVNKGHSSHRSKPNICTGVYLSATSQINTGTAFDM